MPSLLKPVTRYCSRVMSSSLKTPAKSSSLSRLTTAELKMLLASLTKLRKEARENNVYLHVVRNTLLTRALEGTEFECIKDSCKGPTIIGLSLEHPGAAARIFKNFAKTCDAFKVKALAFEGKAYDSKDIDVLATLPTYEEAIAHLMATMKEAAAGKLVRTLAALGEKLGSEGAAE